MKQAMIKNMDKGVSIIAGIFWVAGLLIAGSDSSFMPWINILGLIVFSGASFLIGTRFHKMDRDHRNLIRHEKSLKNQKYAVTPVSSEHRVHMRYA